MAYTEKDYMKDLEEHQKLQSQLERTERESDMNFKQMRRTVGSGDSSSERHTRLAHKEATIKEKMAILETRLNNYSG